MTPRLTYAGTCMGHQPRPSGAPNGWLHNAMPCSCLLIPASLTACHLTTIWAENCYSSPLGGSGAREPGARLITGRDVEPGSAIGYLARWQHAALDDCDHGLP